MIKLEDVFVLPEDATRYASQKWTKEDVKNAVKYALWNITTNSYYAPYLDRYPVVLEDEFSERVKREIEGHETMACTEGQRVYFDTERASEILAELYEKEAPSNDIGAEVQSVIAHEYTHIICEHNAIGEALARRFKGRVPRGVSTCHLIACEIQANRGIGVNKGTVIYKHGVTEEDFPCVKGLYNYSDIFSALLKEYNKQKKEMEKFAQQIADMFGDSISEQNKNGSSKSKSKKGEKAGEKSQSQTSGLTDKEQMEKKEQETEDGELTEEDIKQAIDEAEKAEQEVLSEIQEFGGGYGLDKVDDDKLELIPDTRQKVEYERWDEERIKNEIKRMRGYVAGSFAREREKSYSRPSRRNIDPSSTLLRKGVKNGKRSMPKVLVAMDSSGSMGGTPVTVVATAIGNLFKDLGRPTEGCYIVKHESRCSEPKPLREWEEVVKSFRPSGGNCFNNVVKLANELDVDVVFNIGDGCDCCVRRYYENGEADTECQEFVSAGRKWVDTLILDKKENGYFDGEWKFDDKNGFHREIIQLGAKIKEYL